ncbi:hypothetical protein C4K46_09495 [Streptococcus oricebi]|uniref:Uncharacterized protein n=1 Tax=Streptococcus oricebi TaxID=1547447 RepID=A0ABS5B6N4_9STRE|nr:hypothetical protein [Streptococcus oricebi]
MVLPLLKKIIYVLFIYIINLYLLFVKEIKKEGKGPNDSSPPFLLGLVLIFFAYYIEIKANKMVE